MLKKTTRLLISSAAMLLLCAQLASAQANRPPAAQAPQQLYLFPPTSTQIGDQQELPNEKNAAQDGERSLIEKNQNHAGIIEGGINFEDADIPSKFPAPPQELRERIRSVLETYKQRPLNTVEHSPWEVMHRIVALGLETEIEIDRPGGKRQTAIGSLLFNYSFRGQRLLSVNGDAPVGRDGAGLQGHPGQLLAILAQAKLDEDYPIRVDGREFAVKDLIRAEQWTCRSGTELTFKLIGLSHYLPSDAMWKSYDGQEWSIERLLREEMAQPIQGATCGGTHRLMGLTYAMVTRKQQGLPITGDFLRAETYLNEYLDYALKTRNPDGSMSTSYLGGRAADPSSSTRLRTTGHVLEWMTFALSSDALRDPEIVESVDYLTKLLESNPDRSWDIGPLGHALHALSIFEQRAWTDTSAGRRSLTEVSSER